MENTAESQNFMVDLVAIAEDVQITTDEMLGEGETTQSTLLFFHVTNMSDESVVWWDDENHFIGSDGFQYKHGENIYDGMGDTHDVVPPHWYPNPTIQPGAKARCVTEIPEFPEELSVERIIYDYDGEQYEIEVDESVLEDPPV